MKIGIDLTPLQSPHRLRGIGITIIRLINNLPASLREKNEFIFFLYPKDIEKTLNLLDLVNLTYSVRKITKNNDEKMKLPGKLNLLPRILYKIGDLVKLHIGDSSYGKTTDLDFFLQTDPDKSLPRSRRLRTGIVVYDLIPYILEWDYLWSYKTARQRGQSRKASFRINVRRYLYKYKLKINCARANKVFTISKQTRDDLVRIISTKKEKIHVTPLGVSTPKFNNEKSISIKRYYYTPWGYLPRTFTIEQTTRYILFVGGADPRRKLDQLVSAFNSLRAEGLVLKMIFAGDSMQGPNNISTNIIRNALLNCSYIDDVIFLGFIDDDTRDWLYRNAQVFIFPSMYEGFGLPVLEAMAYGCPVISYDNPAIREVAGDKVIYANNAESIRKEIINVISWNENERKKHYDSGIRRAKKYTWAKSSNTLFSHF